MDAFRVSDRVLGIVVGVGALAYLAVAWRIPAFSLGTVPVQPRVFPVGLGLLMLGLALALVLRPARSPADADRAPADEVEDDSSPEPAEVVLARASDPRVEVAAALAAVIAYVALLEPLGFVLATVGYLMVMAWWWGFGRPLLSGAVAVGVALGLHLGLSGLLGVRLPAGVLAPLGM